MRPDIVAIVGPTASGKSAAAIEAAKALNGEVLSMDSMQIYERLTIGTAKPSEQELSEVPHHLLSYVNPEKAYCVSDYQTDARRTMEEVLERGKLPVFCGGTGLYLQAVSHPIRFTDAQPDMEVREELFRLAQTQEGVLELYERLRKADPVYAAKMHPNDTRRVIRALEVWQTTGIPFSVQQNDWDEEPQENWHIYGIRWEREHLIQRINERVDAMMTMGLEEEVRGLLKSGMLPASQAMQAIGYKELAEAVLGHCTLGEAVNLIKQRTRQYAKRQMTWYRRNPDIIWFDAEQYPSAKNLQQAMLQQIRMDLKNSQTGKEE